MMSLINKTSMKAVSKLFHKRINLKLLKCSKDDKNWINMSKDDKEMGSFSMNYQLSIVKARFYKSFQSSQVEETIIMYQAS